MEMLRGFVNSGEVACTRDSRIVFGVLSNVYKTGRRPRKLKVMKKLRDLENSCMEVYGRSAQRGVARRCSADIMRMWKEDVLFG
jgi:hypothetical protein